MRNDDVQSSREQFVVQGSFSDGRNVARHTLLYILNIQQALAEPRQAYSALQNYKIKAREYRQCINGQVSPDQTLLVPSSGYSLVGIIHQIYEKAWHLHRRITAHD